MRLRLWDLLTCTLCMLVLTNCNSQPQEATINSEKTPEPAISTVPRVTPTVNIDQTLAAMQARNGLTFQEVQELSRYIESRNPLYQTSQTLTLTATIEEQQKQSYRYFDKEWKPFWTNLTANSLKESEGWINVAGKADSAKDGYAASIYMYDPYSDYLPNRPSLAGYRNSGYPDLDLVGLTTEQAREMKTGQRIKFEGQIEDVDTPTGLLKVRNKRYEIIPEEQTKLQKGLTASDMKNITITLARTGCFGDCPSYTVNIYGDGRVVFQGEQYTHLIGEATDKLDHRQLEELVAEFQRVDFFSLQNVYKPDATDNPSAIISITIAGKNKRVIHNLSSKSAPRRLILLEEKIDQTAIVPQWIR